MRVEQLLWWCEEGVGEALLPSGGGRQQPQQCHLHPHILCWRLQAAQQSVSDPISLGTKARHQRHIKFLGEDDSCELEVRRFCCLVG